MLGLGCRSGLALLGLFTLVTSGCAQGLPPLGEPRPGETLVYGRIALPDHTQLHGLTLFRMRTAYAIPFNNPPEARVWREGYFLREGLDTGEYYPASFLTTAAEPHYFGWTAKEVRAFTPEVKVGRTAYMGTFEIEDIPPSGLSDDGFEVRVNQSADEEKQVLQWLIARVEGTGWEARLRERLARL